MYWLQQCWNYTQESQLAFITDPRKKGRDMMIREILTAREISQIVWEVNLALRQGVGRSFWARLSWWTTLRQLIPLSWMIDHNHVFTNYFRHILHIIPMTKLKIRHNVIIFLLDNRKKYPVVSVFLERCSNRIPPKIFSLLRAIVRWSKLNVRARIQLIW